MTERSSPTRGHDRTVSMTTNHPVPTPLSSEPAPSLRPCTLPGGCDPDVDHDHDPLFEGHAERTCGEHRTVGSHRAWCYDCSEWCYPARDNDDPMGGACSGCRMPWLEARLRAAEETLAAVGALAEKWRAYQQTGFYPEASAHANAIENCGDALADLLADRAALAEGASR